MDLVWFIFEPFIRFFSNIWHTSTSTIHQFTERMSDIHIHMGWVWIVALLFILLHYGRRFPIVRQVSIIASFIPVLIHELGHAVMATITRSPVRNIHIVLTHLGQSHTGSQGFADTVPRNKVSGILIFLAGYLSPPLFFALGFYFIHRHQAYVYILILLLLGVYYLIHSDQKWIPIAIIFAMVMSGYQFYVSSDMIHYLHDYGYSIFLGLLLGEMIQSVVITTQLTFTRHTSDWDGSMLKNETFIPAVFWWALWTTFTVFTIIFTLFN